MKGMIKIKEKPEKRPLFKESICSFLKARKVPIIIFTGIVVIFGYSFVYMTYLLMRLFMESSYRLYGVECVS